MKALVVTGSRADRNCQEMVHEALLKAGHQSQLSQWGGRPTVNTPDIAVVAGDRIEILEAALWNAQHRIPTCHISGGDVTEGSADDRHRDAITALACIHCAETDVAFNRLTGGDYVTGPLIHKGDKVYLTGNPAIDRIKQTPTLSKFDTLAYFGFDWNKGGKYALVCVHPNTVGDNPQADFRAVWAAMIESGLQVVWIGANADPFGEDINQRIERYCSVHPTWRFSKDVSPQLYYSLMRWCDVMIGNSSAMLCEAPMFGLPCVLVGDRQYGRVIPDNVVWAPQSHRVDHHIEHALTLGRIKCDNPYGDGNSAPRIVKALEENAWRWQ